MKVRLADVEISSCQGGCCSNVTPLVYFTTYDLFPFHTSEWPYSLQPSNKIDIFPYRNHFTVHMSLIHSP
jgi:hypothetical protein